jgi:hypothetical protein
MYSSRIWAGTLPELRARGKHSLISPIWYGWNGREITVTGFW